MRKCHFSNKILIYRERHEKVRSGSIYERVREPKKAFPITIKFYAFELYTFLRSFTSLPHPPTNVCVFMRRLSLQNIYFARLNQASSECVQNLLSFFSHEFIMFPLKMRCLCEKFQTMWNYRATEVPPSLKVMNFLMKFYPKKKVFILSLKKI